MKNKKKESETEIYRNAIQIYDLEITKVIEEAIS